jgi:hypothetical protein
MLDQIALGAIVSAIATVLTDKTTGGILSKLQSQPAKKDFEKALKGAIQHYTSTDLRSKLAQPLIKRKSLLIKAEVADELVQVIRFERQPNFEIIAQHWKEAMENPPQDVNFLVEVQTFVEYLKVELSLTTFFQPVLEAKSLKVIASKLDTLITLMNAQASNKIRNEILDQTDIIGEKTQNFVGRQFVFDAIKQFIATNPCGYFLVQGEPGIGKSAVAAKFVKHQGCIHHFNIRAEGINTASIFLKNICAQLVAVYDLDYQTLPPQATQDGGFFSQLLRQITAKLSINEKLIIMIDGLDEVGDTDFVAGVNKLYLPRMLPSRVYMIVTTRPGITLRIDCEQGSLLIDQDSTNNLTDIREYVAKSVELMGIKTYIARHNIDNKEFIDNLIAKSQGNFMYLRHVLPEIEKGTYTDLKLGSIPIGLQNYYQDHWQRMRGLDEEVWFKYKLPVVLALTQVDDPVSIDLLAKFSGVKERARISKVLEEWKPFLYKMQVEYQGELQKRYRIYHTSFADFLKHQEEVMEKGVNLDAVNKHITDSLKERWITEENK